MKLTLIFLELLKITSDNFLSKVTKAHAPFSIVFWFMPNLKAKIKITKSVPEYYLGPHFMVLQMSYFILFYFLLFFKVCFLHSSNHHPHQMSILNLLSGFSSSEIISLSHHFDQVFPPQELWLVSCLPYVMFCFPISAEQTQTNPFSLFVVVP